MDQKHHLKRWRHMGDVIDYIEKKQEKDMLNNFEELGRQIREKDTPSKKSSRDNNLLMEKGEFSTSNERLYKYDLDFKRFFKTISDIVSEKQNT